VLSRFLAIVALSIALVPAARAEDALPTVTVWKSPNCGCCVKWIEHLRAAGFEVEAREARNLNAVRAQLGVPARLAGCHSAKVGDYLVEGHVPAEQVKSLLADKPDVAGISVPGMPVGSPGMEGPGGKDYDVLAFDKAGNTRVFATVKPLAR
jgi:hypothetical protein